MIAIGQDRECFFDDYLVNVEKTDAWWHVHQPIRRECVLEHNEPWEGNGCNYHNFFWDDGIYRMYYLSWWMLDKSKGIRVCYAESTDGLHWEKPSFGICEFEGSYENNIVLDTTIHPHIDNFMVFRDDNPQCDPAKRYKGICSNHLEEGFGLWYYYSADAIHFTRGGIITDQGAFDSLNVMFWDEKEELYRCYYRAAHYKGSSELCKEMGEIGTLRDIRMIESADFEHWSEQKLLDFGEAEEMPLYTNVIQPYPRAPRVYVGFPSRYIERKQWNNSFEELCGVSKRRERMTFHPRYGLTLTDCVFMNSRDGLHFKRYDEAFSNVNSWGL